jgi:hypothetical protein
MTEVNAMAGLSRTMDGMRYTTARGPWLTVPAGEDPPALPGVELVTESLGERVSREQLAALAEVEETAARAHRAREALAGGRPGGEVWRQAEAADGEVAVSGKAVKSWRLAELVRGDLDRWAEAVALRSAWLARSATFAGREAAALRRSVRVAAAVEVGNLEAAILPIAQRGWTEREDKPAAWAARSEADQLARKLWPAVALRRWGSGEVWDGQPRPSMLPAGAAGGTLHALRMILDGQNWAGGMAGLTYPPGLDKVIKQGAPLLPVVGR